MFSPTVTELPRPLEAISRDTFNDAVRVPAPRPGVPRMPVSSVVRLPATASARDAARVAA